MIRRLSAAERQLWSRLRRTVSPLRKEQSAEEPEAAPKAVSQTAKIDAAAPALRSPAPRRPEPEPRLLVLEDKLRRRLSRGLVDVDARIDLHGMSQDRAFASLLSFLRHAQARGDRLVLVITGKGRAGAEGRGVLRMAVPGWLSRPDLRDLVSGCEEAGRRHGGSGALYVRLRRRGQRTVSGSALK